MSKYSITAKGQIRRGHRWQSVEQRGFQWKLLKTEGRKGAHTEFQYSKGWDAEEDRGERCKLQD